MISKGFRRFALPAPCIALVSAGLFGASTPFAKLLTGEMRPEMLAGLLYLGSGLGLSLLILARANGKPLQPLRLTSKDLIWLLSAIAFGGVIGPLLLMIGLTTTAGSQASLLLNLEAVFTALLAWFAFKENFDMRVVAGMVAIVIGSVILCWSSGISGTVSFGSLAIAGACLCWAIDNNCTRNVSEMDPTYVAASKGLVAGLVNTGIALARGSASVGLVHAGAALAVGFFGYGLSLVMFIKALRFLGTARTGAYFSTAPFAGALLSLVLLHEPINGSLLLGAAFMCLGVWLHLTEVHEHEHSHPELEHEHMHSHDEHHQHEHDFQLAPGQEHSHWHKHEAITHSHPHYPDLHHRHEH